MRPLHFVTYHGWALGSAFWEPLKEQLRAALSFRELLFHTCDDPSFPLSERDTILLTHSFGAMRRYLHHPSSGPTPRATICCAGFSQFIASQSSPEGVPTRLLERMIQRFQKTPTAVVEEFLTRAASPFSSNNVPTAVDHHAGGIPANGLDRLLDELRTMLQENTSSLVVGRREPLLSLACADDTIVAPAVSARLVRASIRSAEHSSRFVCFQTGGHLFPFFKPMETAQAITTFLEEVLE
jgi:pimeloyl-[acyl-carrier protein] methyl ester esterase